MHAGTSVKSPGGLFTAEILIAGIPQPLFKTADGYPYAAGEPGQSCQVRVWTLASRIGVALSVDGRDALEDRPADLFRTSLHIIASEYTFKGFRIDDDRTREFAFGTVAGSVADQAGDAANVGVIGIAAWRERKPVVSYMTPVLDSYMTQPVATASAGVTTRSLGMHAGETRHDPVGRTTFERDGSPDVLEIGYDTLAALEAMGLTRQRPKALLGRTTGYEGYRP